MRKISKMRADMKKLSSFLLAGAVAVLSIASCSDKISSDKESLYTYRFTLSTPSSKAVLDSDETSTFTKWESGDQLGVYTMNTDLDISCNTKGDIDVSKSPVEFSINSTYALAVGSEVYTYFPYDSSNSTGDAQDPSKVSLSIPVAQTGKMNDMPMVGVPYIVTEAVEAETDTPVADINLYNLGGIFQFNIFSTNEAYRSETVKSIAFTADSEIAGSFTFDITQVKVLTITGNTEKSINVTASGNPGADKASALQANMVVKPGTYTGTVVVTTDAATYTYTITSGKTVDRSHIKPLNVDLASGERSVFEKYVAISAVSKIQDGAKVLLVANNNNGEYYQLPVSPTVNGGKITGEKISVSDNFTYATSSSAWTIKSSGSYWTITDGNKEIYHENGGTSETNLEYGDNTSNYLWSITVYNAALKIFKMSAVASDKEKDRGMLYRNDKNCFGGYSLSNISNKDYTGIMFFVREADIPVVAVTGISLDKSELSLAVEKTTTLTATVTPSDATNQNVTWTSDNTAVAAVSDEGLVTAIAVGTANITVTTEDGAYTATCAVTVTEFETKVLIIDGSQLSENTSEGDVTKTYSGIDIVFSKGAKQQSSSGDNKFTDNAILIGKSGTYIYNKTAIPGKIVKFEIYANKGASKKVSVGVNFSAESISAYSTSAANTFTATLDNVDKVYDCSDKLPEGAKYFWYQVTNSNNSQVQFRITYEE